ncbi:MAG: adenosylcobinamide-phosphate synthase CbiB [Acidobacteria bacterium]|nr:adenosylcobinamide-phosphate synthase CbiB [Acidobacteriota bacterium]
MPHPVRLIGFMASRAEKQLRKVATSRHALLLLGVLVAIAIPSVAAAATRLLLEGITRLSQLAGYIATVWIAYTTLSVRGLDQAARAVMIKLKKAQLPKAREALAMIVGRDTQTLDKPEIMRAVIETVAENTSDGFVAPLFYLAIGGVPAAVAYKAINTLDSMFGYKNERYLYFGRAAARLDDAANYLPARLTAALVTLSALALRMPWKKCVQIVLRDARLQPSPNAGFPEAAYAGALRVRLGGSNVYDGCSVHKPYLGDAIRPLAIRIYPELRRLLYITSILALALWIALAVLFRGMACL